MPLFRKSAAQRYAELGPLLLPAFCDPTTYLVLETATKEMTSYCARAAGFRPELGGQWREEVRRLVTDGYVLGRVEEGTEKEHLRFSAARLKIDEPEKLFAFICAGAVRNATSGDPFPATRPRDGEIAEMLQSFPKESALIVIESIGAAEAESVDWKRFGAVAVTSLHIGREIAIVEGYFLNPAKRKQLDVVLLTFRDVGDEMIEEYAERLRDLVRRLGHS